MLLITAYKLLHYSHIFLITVDRKQRFSVDNSINGVLRQFADASSSLPQSNSEARCLNDGR